MKQPLAATRAAAPLPPPSAEVTGEPVPTRAEAARAAFDEGDLAGCGRRLAAHAWDGMIYVVCSTLLWSALLTGRSHFKGPVAPALLFLVLLAMLPVYHALFTGSRLVATPARDAAGIAVVDASTGEPIGFRRAYLRAVCSLIGAVAVLPSLIAAFDARKQSWADRVAHTVVVRQAQRFRGMKTPTEVVVCVAIIAFMSHVFLTAIDLSTQNYRRVDAAEFDLHQYASLLDTRRAQGAAAAVPLDSLGYVPRSRSTRYLLSPAGVLYAEFTLDELSSAGGLDPGFLDPHRSYLSLYPEYDAATGRTAWHCRYLGFGKIYPPRDCQESPDADPSLAGLSE